jgi:zinc protease
MGNDNVATFQSVSQNLDHIRRELAINAGGNEFKVLTGLAGDKGWRDLGGNRTELDKDAIANEKRRTYLDLIPITILPLKGGEFKVEAIGEETAGGKAMVGVKATGPDGKEFRLYFDKESGLPVRMVARVAGFMGDEFTQETTYSDYREMSGIQRATKLQSKRDGEKFIDQQITEFRILDTVDPKTFADP